MCALVKPGCVYIQTYRFFVFVGCQIGLTSQLAQQQQQLVAMVQTQSLLAAIQAQASAAAKNAGRKPPSLLQGPRMNDNRGRMGDRNNRKRRMSPPRGGQRMMNQSNQRQRRMQQYRNMQGNRPGYQQRRDYDRDRKRVSESSLKSEENEPIEEPYVEETLGNVSCYVLVGALGEHFYLAISFSKQNQSILCSCIQFCISWLHS